MITTSLGLALYAEPNALVMQKHTRNPKLTARGESRIAVVYSLPVLLAAVFLARVSCGRSLCGHLSRGRHPERPSGREGSSVERLRSSWVRTDPRQIPHRAEARFMMTPSHQTCTPCLFFDTVVTFMLDLNF